MNNSSSNDSVQKRFGSSYFNSKSHLDDTQAIDPPKSSLNTILIEVDNNDTKEEEKKDENNDDKDDKEDKKKKENDLRIIDHIYYFPDEKKDKIIVEKTKMEKNNIEIDSKDNNHKNVILQDLKFKGFKNENNSESIDSIEEVEYDSDSDSDNWINDESTNKDINAIYSEIKDLLKSNIKNNIFSNTYFRFPIKNEKTLYCIPEIKFEKRNLLFIYDDKKLKLTYKKIKELIQNKEIFINKNDEKINQVYIGQTHNKTFENNSQNKKNINLNAKYLKKTKNRINHYIYFYRYFKEFHYLKRATKIIMKDLNNKNISAEYKDMLKFKLIHFSIILKKKLIFSFYISIIKSLIKEMETQNKKSNKKYYDIIKENLIYCNKYIRYKIKGQKRRKIKKK